MPTTITRLIGVYDADGTVLGEISYFLQARVGRAHCALCDITHGLVRERADWRTARDGLPVVFATYHRDDQPAAARDLSAGRLPVVVAEIEGADPVLLLDGDALDGCAGDPGALVGAVRAAAADLGLQFDGPA